MTRSLLDVSVLLALVDAAHEAHDRSHAWWREHVDASDGWASAAITQLGFVRILSRPAYPNAVTVAEAFALLRRLTEGDRHEWWPSDLAFTDDTIDVSRLLGHRQITDAYLLALAVRRGGRFVTLDRRIDRSVVRGATAGQLVTI